MNMSKSDYAKLLIRAEARAQRKLDRKALKNACDTYMALREEERLETYRRLYETP